MYIGENKESKDLWGSVILTEINIKYVCQRSYIQTLPQTNCNAIN